MRLEIEMRGGAEVQREALAHVVHGHVIAATALTRQALRDGITDIHTHRSIVCHLGVDRDRAAVRERFYAVVNRVLHQRLNGERRQPDLRWCH